VYLSHCVDCHCRVNTVKFSGVLGVVSTYSYFLYSHFRNTHTNSRMTDAHTSTSALDIEPNILLDQGQGTSVLFALYSRQNS
jgi:hypothetical protein